MTPWRYQNKTMTTLQDFPEGTLGFVYKVEFSNGMKYVGKKVLTWNKTLPPLKGFKRKRKVVKESDWKKYFGSIKAEELKPGVKDGSITVTDRKILYLCNTKSELTYYELKVQFASDCILRDNYYNANILGRIYSKNTEWKH